MSHTKLVAMTGPEKNLTVPLRLLSAHLATRPQNMIILTSN